MAVKSKFSFLSKFGLAFIHLITVGFPLMFFLLPPNDKTPDSIHQYVSFGIVYFILIIFMLWIMSNFKYIHVKKKKIGFRNFYSSKMKFIPFKYLDGYIESRATNKYGQNYAVIYLIKNSKKVAWICSAYYDNYYEIQENIMLEYLGNESPGIIKQTLDYFEMIRYSRKYLKDIYTK